MSHEDSLKRGWRRVPGAKQLAKLPTEATEVLRVLTEEFKPLKQIAEEVGMGPQATSIMLNVLQAGHGLVEFEPQRVQYIVVKVSAPPGYEGDIVNEFRHAVAASGGTLRWEPDSGPYDSPEAVGEALFDIDSQ